jgi:hypothetical protein
MSRIYEDTVKQISCRRLVSCVCDWCGKEIDKERETMFFTFSCEFAKGEVRQRHVSPNGWSIADLCDDCIEKLRIMFIDAGIHLSKYDG